MKLKILTYKSVLKKKIKSVKALEKIIGKRVDFYEDLAICTLDLF